ncbi:MAG: hypothetical protein ABIP13_01010, partial [Tepidiformaceae bacterium]
KEAMVSGLRAIPGVEIFGEPQLWAFAFGAPDVEMQQVAALMGKRGWMCGTTTQPKGIHMMPTPVHEAVAAEYVAAVAECIALARHGDTTKAKAAAYNEVVKVALCREIA